MKVEVESWLHRGRGKERSNMYAVIRAAQRITVVRRGNSAHSFSV
jgi:hypothetical protein